MARPRGSSTVEQASPTGDSRARHKGVRRGRERGCWVYVPKELLDEAGVATDAPPPEYRLWAGPRRTVMVTLYDRKESSHDDDDGT